MNNLISPYDLGDNNLVEHTQRIDIGGLVRQAQKELKLRLVEAQIEADGIQVTLTTSKTRFNGERLWFVCPMCARRAGTIYQIQQSIGCRKCLKLRYKQQRFKRMLENKI